MSANMATILSRESWVNALQVQENGLARSVRSEPIDLE